MQLQKISVKYSSKAQKSSNRGNAAIQGILPAIQRKVHMKRKHFSEKLKNNDENVMRFMLFVFEAMISNFKKGSKSLSES